MRKCIGSISLLASLGFLAFVASCGGSGSNGGAPLILVHDAVQSSGTQSNSAGLSLALPTTSSTVSAVNETLVGCSSARTLTCTSQDFYVYNSDQNCILKLNTFTNNGVNFSASSACSSITWKAGTQCAFTSTNVSPAQTVSVSVIQQLSSPIVTTDYVVYEFAQIQQGALQAFTQSSISFDAPSALIAQAAPQYTVKQLNYYGINTTGSGSFSFDLQCLQQMIVDPSNPTQALTKCADAPLSSLDYVLVAYPTAGITSATTASQLAALMAGGTDTLITWQGATNSTASDKLNGTNGVTSIGGFATKIMVGPGQISTTAGSNMLLILRETTVNGGINVQSYLTFQITLPALPGCQAETTGGTCLTLMSK